MVPQRSAGGWADTGLLFNASWRAAEDAAGIGPAPLIKGACSRAARPKTPKLVEHPELAVKVAKRLKLRWSPHAISADLRSENVTVSAETIYKACYDPTGKHGLAADSWRRLPSRRRRRKPTSRCGQVKRSPLGDYRPLNQRPASVDDRAEPGHWEGDLVVGAGNASAVATLVERTSRHVLVVALPDGYGADATATAVTAALARQPSHLIKTLTWDQGREMTRRDTTSKPHQASRSSSANRTRRGSAPPTNKPTSCSDAGYPKEPT
ncbi:MAG: IS30 family transposase [Acidimicrobiaceae bacterium]|nr:IS30 family transposase [Acidimicrobiaceae bacterium]MYG55736.1 IS30 family transposase [Acidimicrobiaceae bacterium]MYJ98286.1 IS30 family transposase [Acidimicrobiaceae bacterium]